MSVRFRVNGREVEVDVEPRLTLADCLRHHLRLTGTHVGCEHGVCGACTVLVDGAAVRSCLMRIAQLSPNEITTLEGLGTIDKPHPLQKAFIDEQAAQCGYCTSGMIIVAADLLNRNPQPTEAEVRGALNFNLCRCGSHNRIVRAVMRVAQANGRT